MPIAGLERIRCLCLGWGIWRGWGECFVCVSYLLAMIYEKSVQWEVHKKIFFAASEE